MNSFNAPCYNYYYYCGFFLSVFLHLASWQICPVNRFCFILSIVSLSHPQISSYTGLGPLNFIEFTYYTCYSSSPAKMAKTSSSGLARAVTWPSRAVPTSLKHVEFTFYCMGETLTALNLSSIWLFMLLLYAVYVTCHLVIWSLLSYYK